MMYIEFIFDVVFILFNMIKHERQTALALLEFLNSNKKVLNKSPILQTKLVKAPLKHKDEAGCCSDASNALWKKIHNHFYTYPNYMLSSRAEKCAKHGKKQVNSKN